MKRKHFIFPLALLSSCATTQSFFGDRWMSDMMREMEESFGRMHHMMEEAFEHSHNKAISKSSPHLKHTMQQQDENVLFTLEKVARGDINAQFNDNILNIKHPHFTLKITQLKNRYNQPLLSIEMRSEQTTTKEEDENNEKKSFFGSAISSSTETASIAKPVELDNPEIAYDEDTQTLTIKLPHKSGKKIPVMVKRSSETITS